MNSSRSRGIALTTWLVLLSMFALFGLFVFLVAWQKMLAIYPHWSVYSLAAIAVLRVPAVILMWSWSKIGFVLFVSLTAIAIPICLAAGFRQSLFSLAGVAILAILVSRKWATFRWLPVWPEQGNVV